VTVQAGALKTGVIATKAGLVTSKVASPGAITIGGTGIAGGSSDSFTSTGASLL